MACTTFFTISSIDQGRVIYFRALNNTKVIIGLIIEYDNSNQIARRNETQLGKNLQEYIANQLWLST